MRYYYKDQNGNYYNLKEIREDLISITEEEWNEANKEIEYIPKAILESEISN